MVGGDGAPLVARHKGQVGVGVALESAWSCAGACGASVRSTLGLRRWLGTEGVSPRGGGAQELRHPLQEHIAAAL